MGEALMKKIILISLGVIVLVAAGLGAYVSLIDWNKHKDGLARQISEVIGKQVEFSGNLEVSYFPHPIISAQSVNVVNPQTNDTIAKISQLKTDVSLISLIKGAPDIQTLHLVDAELWLTFDEEGHNNWLQRSSADFVENNEFLMKTINIVNSKLHLSDKAHDILFDLDNFTAEITAASANGPYRLDGNFTKGDERYGTALQIDALSQIDDTNLMFVILHQGSNSYVRYDGSYNISNNTFKGFVKGDFKQTSDFINAVAGKTLLPEVYNVPLQFTVDAAVDGQKIELTHFSVVFSQLMAGSGEIIVSQTPKENGQIPVTVKYQLRDFDFRPLWTQFKEKFAQYQKGEKFAPKWPYDIDYDLSSVRVIVSDRPEGVLENVSIKGQVRSDGFSIDDFYAGCAGNIVLNITGNLAANEGVPVCSLNVIADGRNFRSMVNSLGFDLQAPSQGAYQSGKVTASVKITPDNIQVEELNSTMDKSNVKMSANIGLLNNTYDINFTADKLNLDNYIYAPAQDAPKDLETTLKHYLSEIAKLQNKSLHLKADVAEAVFRSVPVKKLQIDMQYADGGLTITKAATEDALNTSAEVAAIMPDIKSGKPQFDTLSFNIKSQDLLPLIKKMNLPLPEWQLFSQNNILINGNLKGNFNEIALNINAAADTDSFSYEGAIKKMNEKPQYDGDFVLKTTRLDQLLNKVGITGADKSYRGAFNGKAHISGRRESLLFEKTEFQLGPSLYTGSFTLKEGENTHGIKGEINVNEMNWAQFIKVQKDKNTTPPASTAGDTFISRPNLSKDQFDFTPYRNWDLDVNVITQKSIYQDLAADNLKVRVVGSNGTLLLQNISANVGDIIINGNAKLDYKQAPKIVGTLSWGKIKLKDFGGSVYALSTDDMSLSMDFETSAQSLESLLSGLSGTAKIKTSGVKVKGINLFAVEKDLAERRHSKGLFQMVQDALQTGVTSFNPISATVPLKNGVASLDAIALKNEHTNATLSGKVNLKDWRINTSVDVQYPLLQDIPSYSFEMTSALNKPIMDISIGNIARKYDAYWDKVAQEEQAEKDKIKQALEERASQVKTQITNLNGRIDALKSMSEKYAAKRLVLDTIFKYNAKKERLVEMSKELQGLNSQAGAENVDNDTILQLERQVQIIRQEVDIIEEEIKTFLLSDVDRRMEEISDKFERENSGCANSLKMFDEILDSAAEKLEKMNAKQYLTNDKGVNKEHDTAVKAMNIASGIYNDFIIRRDKIKAMPEGAGRVEAIGTLDQGYMQLQQQCIAIMEARKAAGLMVNKIVEDRKVIYDREQLAAEKKRLAEEAEDAGNLLVEKKAPATSATTNPVVETAKTSADVKPEEVADKKDDTAAENNTSAQPATAVENKTETTTAPAERVVYTPGVASGKIIRSYDTPEVAPVQPEATKSILRPVEGVVQKPSGTIIVK